MLAFRFCAVVKLKIMFEKQIWKLFKMNMSDFNKADRQIEKILLEVYEKGKKEGKKEQNIKINTMLRSALANYR
jgi:hypothetical protein